MLIKNVSKAMAGGGGGGNRVRDNPPKTMLQVIHGDIGEKRPPFLCALDHVCATAEYYQVVPKANSDMTKSKCNHHHTATIRSNTNK
eukprot:m.66132 g.66132  ORF g.66132 m.66132 type:complete len:87 (+) comp19697_c1_seq1:175-435(+)